ncbi:hypothetical protein DFH29DRAFT_933415 [Suillus ampliporus]|nr:hypothetical protein DFH29DRAFT_933415 [Suillus ampliporus]
MEDLFNTVDGDVDADLLHALEICYLPSESTDEQVESNVPRDNPAPDVADNSDIILEAVGYTRGDHAASSREAMKVRGLAYVLDRNRFLVSRAGSKFVSDNDPGGIEDFYRVARTKPQYISFETQVKNLLRQDDSPFKGGQTNRK